MTEHEWDTCAEPKEMLTSLNHGHGMEVSDRKLRLFACSCCRQVWGRLTDQRGRYAVEVAEKFADGEATVIDKDSAYVLGPDVEYTGALTIFESVLADDPATGVKRVLSTNWVAPGVQADILRDLIGNPFRPVTLPHAENCPSWAWPKTRTECGCRCDWLTPQVVQLAELAYQDNGGRVCGRCGQSGYNPGCHHGTGNQGVGQLDPLTLSAVADALEEAGIGDEACRECDGTGHIEPYARCGFCESTGRVPHPLIAHLRSPGDHWRGCFAIDLLLGEE